MQQIQRPIAFSVESTTLTATKVKITQGQCTDVRVTKAKQYLLRESEYNHADMSANVRTGNLVTTTTKPL
jgi:hypothetical protein